MEIYLFDITPNNFEKKALEVFQYQVQHNAVYSEYIKHLGLVSSQVKQMSHIPFLPIEFFKTHKVFHQQKKVAQVFTSSGTTGFNSSKHYVSNLKIYEQSFQLGFEKIFGSISNYCILALLPSYLEREGSSLIYMTKNLIEKSEHIDSGFYLHNLKALSEKLIELDQKGQKIILLGVSYALLDLIEDQKFQLKNTIIIETGGMKGHRKEMVKEEFYNMLKSGFGVQQIHSEYGMTELLSQAYATDHGHYFCPDWMRVLIRDVNDPFCILPSGKSGGINIIDLANIDSCSFIATQDLGKINQDNSFSVLGRFDNSDIRGCNLLIRS